MKIYLFDVDATLECSNGPVAIESLINLRADGHILGICGNWPVFTSKVPGWHEIISLVTTHFMYARDGVRCDKVDFMNTVKRFCAADEYVFVGNSDQHPMDEDSGAAARAGWRFIKEDAFAAGER